MRTPLIAGNWKMHKTLREARELAGTIREGARNARGVDVLLCPPFPYLLPVGESIAGSPIMLGAQNLHEEPQGAYTGEVSAAMLVDTGCKWVIIGHSERRHVFGEPGHRLAKKVRAAVTAGLTSVYCVGETLEEREAQRTEAVIRRQMEEVIAKDIPAERLTIAYEPVWAIGTGRNASPAQAQEVHALIRAWLAGVYGQAAADKIRLLYGGSVKPGNAKELLAQPDVDGALVGGACLVPADFLAIISAAQR